MGCISKECAKWSMCARAIEDGNDVAWATSGTGSANNKEHCEQYYCGERGNYKMFKPFGEHLISTQLKDIGVDKFSTRLDIIIDILKSINCSGKVDPLLAVDYAIRQYKDLKKEGYIKE